MKYFASLETTERFRQLLTERKIEWGAQTMTRTVATVPEAGVLFEQAIREMSERKKAEKEKARPKKLPKITAKQEGGDDGYCYVIRIDGKEFLNGLTRSELPYYKQRALETWKERNHYVEPE